MVTWEKNRNLVILLDKVIFISYYSYKSNYTNKEIMMLINLKRVDVFRSKCYNIILFEKEGVIC